MGWTEIILLCVYAIAGAGTWVTLLVLMPFSREKMVRLQKEASGPPLPEPPPAAVIIPAKDEGEGIRDCIRQALGQNYPNFCVVAVDDRSTDQTGRLLDELATQHPEKLRVIHVRPGEVTGDWLGKNNALYRATHDLRDRGATAEWFLFIDSDVKITPDALRRAIEMCVTRGYDAMTVLTRLDCPTFVEELVMPLVAGTWAVMFRIALTNDDNLKHIAAANGQFFLIRREAYDSVGGHAPVRDSVVEDVELARLLKRRGYRIRYMLGAHLASTRMYRTLDQMLKGWGRTYAATSRLRMGRLVAVIAFYFVCGYSLYPAIAWSGWEIASRHTWWWLPATLLHFASMTTMLAVIYHGSGNRARFALLFPLGGAVMLAICGIAMKFCRTGRIVWRGVPITLTTPKYLPVDEG